MTAVGDNVRGMRSDSMSGRDFDWKARDQHPPPGPAAKLPSANASSESLGNGAVKSLRARIGDKEPPRSLPQAPSSYRAEPPGERRLEISRDDDRDLTRKRTLSGKPLLSHIAPKTECNVSERDKDMIEPAPGPSEAATQPTKRLRIIRDRYRESSHGLAKKLLPIDPEKGRRNP